MNAVTCEQHSSNWHMHCGPGSQIKRIRGDKIIITFLLFLLLKQAAQAQVGKNKLFINCFRNPASTCAMENLTKYHSGKQPTVDCTLEPIQRSGVKHGVRKVIPHSNLSRQETQVPQGIPQGTKKGYVPVIADVYYTYRDQRKYMYQN